ncbi:hypothetical protein HHX48_02385 [Salinimonas sp. HHU 13199]|uniref:PEP-CTERM sorting domain-containing protein n=1 Tax=Salinimonas profundi TaxID=2729140 RepID=A0ABR8LGY9_9ALTE|nr:hypothetical protein [Salinimonas profundi]MBD3584580.1 hypothetical protein [Salinimonas profundi]
MNLRKAAILLALSAVWQPAYASLLTNGDFGTCTLDGWNTDSDGNSVNSGDFTILSDGGTCSARIYIDQSNIFANTLYQRIDTSTLGSTPLTLSYDFTVDSELQGQAPFTADYFTIGFGDGSGQLYNADGEFGSLFNQPDIDGPMAYQGEVTLSEELNEWDMLTLEIQLISNFDASPAWLTVNSFSLDITNEQVAVSSPATVPLLLCALGLIRRRTSNKQEC